MRVLNSLAIVAGVALLTSCAPQQQGVLAVEQVEVACSRSFVKAPSGIVEISTSEHSLKAMAWPGIALYLDRPAQSISMRTSVGGAHCAGDFWVASEGDAIAIEEARPSAVQRDILNALRQRLVQRCKGHIAAGGTGYSERILRGEDGYPVDTMEFVGCERYADNRMLFFRLRSGAGSRDVGVVGNVVTVF